MQRWLDELTKHQLNTSVTQLLDLLEQDLGIEDPIVESERARFAKFLKALGYEYVDETGNPAYQLFLG